MPKFTFTYEHDDSAEPILVRTIYRIAETGDQISTSYETLCLSISDILLDVQNFLKGCGFNETPTITTTGEVRDQVHEKIYESPDKGKTVYSRSFGETKRERIK